MKVGPQQGGRTIGEEFSRERFEHRVHRTELALAALRRLNGASRPGPSGPAPLIRSIASFRSELARLQRRRAGLR